MKNAGLQCREGAPEPGQFRKVRFEISIFLLPRIAGPVKGIFPTLHSSFISVIDGGRAGEGKEDQCRQPQPLQTNLALGGGEAVHCPVCLAVRYVICT